MGKKKPLPLLHDVLITSVGAEGNAVARVDDMVLFVPMLIPGDIADIRVRKKKKRYMEGEVIALKQPSPDRIEPLCSYFGVCGGCKWQHLPYDLQLRWKAQQVYDNLTRLGNVPMDGLPVITGAPEQYYYRNKLEFTFSSRRWLTREEIGTGEKYDGPGALGFHIPGYFDKVLDISSCHLQKEPSNAIRNSVREYAIKEGIAFFDPVTHEGLLRNLTVRTTTTGEVMVIPVFYRDEAAVISGLLDHLRAQFPAITSLMYIINDKRNDSVHDREVLFHSGRDHIIEEIEGLRFRVGPKSFYQTNPVQARALYDVARDFAGLKGNETVYDLYCGTGTISCFVAGHASKVIGIEYVGEAVSDAVKNSELNNITNTTFFTGDIKELLTSEFFAANGSPDVIITDPPRAGMHGDVVHAIADSGAHTIVYVSCNPATQARDIQLLADRYHVEAIHAVDMFPQTHHIENVVRLTLNSQP
ncbi:MAG: 23S rRNA (uracil(1939)-C(5))-methyltransferase RlmD [Bacteroidales bacterium]|nr:23S rRNA (uracil(1939)-C(5))-methyltransferase RlmD [Bacteroidales bacterium]